MLQESNGSNKSAIARGDLTLTRISLDGTRAKKEYDADLFNLPRVLLFVGLFLYRVYGQCETSAHGRLNER